MSQVQGTKLRRLISRQTVIPVIAGLTVAILGCSVTAAVASTSAQQAAEEAAQAAEQQRVESLNDALRIAIADAQARQTALAVQQLTILKADATAFETSVNNLNAMSVGYADEGVRNALETARLGLTQALAGSDITTITQAKSAVMVELRTFVASVITTAGSIKDKSGKAKADTVDSLNQAITATQIALDTNGDVLGEATNLINRVVALQKSAAANTPRSSGGGSSSGGSGSGSSGEGTSGGSSPDGSGDGSSGGVDPLI